MNIQINIECDTIYELWQHLDELKRQVLKQSKVNKCDPMSDDFPLGTQLSDDNCYGTHELDVIEIIKTPTP